jgi:hypothetical protein
MSDESAQGPPHGVFADSGGGILTDFQATVVGEQTAPMESLVADLVKVYQKNWWLIALLILVNVVGLVGSYFLEGWYSVAATAVLNILSTVIGTYAIIVRTIGIIRAVSPGKASDRWAIVSAAVKAEFDNGNSGKFTPLTECSTARRSLFRGRKT